VLHNLRKELHDSQIIHEFMLVDFLLNKFFLVVKNGNKRLWAAFIWLKRASEKCNFRGN